MPEISVIVPVYKVEPYLHRCVDSILGQSCPNFELILVDDGSPDNCGAICDEYAAKDSRVHVIHQENGGVSVARNAGFDWAQANSDSQWLTFVDSDDWIHRDYLKILLNNAMHFQADISACGLLQVSMKDQIMELQDVPVCCLEPEKAYCDFYQYIMSPCLKLYRKELFEDIRFPAGKIHEDCYVTHIPLFAANRVAITTAQLYYYYANPGSITRKKWSEKRLQEIDAHQVRLDWLLAHGYHDAARQEREEFILVLATQLQAIRALDHGDILYKKHEKKIFSELRRRVAEGTRMGGFPLNPSNCWIYELAYPVKPFWFVYGMYTRIQDKGKKSCEVER